MPAPLHAVPPAGSPREPQDAVVVSLFARSRRRLSPPRAVAEDTRPALGARGAGFGLALQAEGDGEAADDHAETRDRGELPPELGRGGARRGRRDVARGRASQRRAGDWRSAAPARRDGRAGPRQSRTRWSSSPALSDESRRSRRGGSGLTRARARVATAEPRTTYETGDNGPPRPPRGRPARSCVLSVPAPAATPAHNRTRVPRRRARPRLDPGRGYERARCRASAASPRLGRRRRASVVDARCPREATSSPRAARRRRAASA